MKKSLLILSLGLMGLSALAQNPTTFNCVADTWVRQNNLTWNQGGGSDKLEIRMDAIKDGDNVIGYAYFLGLLGFDYSLPSGMKVSSATLRLVTERWKGSEILLYGYSNNFAENTNWETEEPFIEAALDGTPIEQFKPNGPRNKAFTTNDAIDDDYAAIGAWTNEIDVTAYLRSIPATATRVNFMLTPSDADSDSPSTNQNCFYSKDATGAINGNNAALEFTQAEIIPVLYVTFVEDSNSSSDVLAPKADTFVRSSSTANFGGADNMEIYTQTTDEGTNYFVGLMNFQLPSELLSSGYELQGAALRLVTIQRKGDANMGIYAFGNFAENATWNDVESEVLTALGTEPVATFTVAGQGNKALNGKDEIGDDYANLAAWTNIIDLTEYANEVLDSNSASLSFAIAKTEVQNNNNAVKFATKENTGVSGVKADNTTFSFPAADVVPQLTVAYTKTEGTGAVETIIETIDLNAPVEYYDLSGRRVANPDKGVYIMRQGEKAVKVIK